MKPKKITKNTEIGKALEQNSKAAEILFERGISCVGCPMAQMETLEQGLKGHGIGDKEIGEIIKELNKDDKNRPNKKYILEIQDMIYGLKNYKELRPNKKRINALKKLIEKTGDKGIQEIVDIFESGHGLLSNKKRINELKKVLEEVE